jgi:cyanophycinase-like exopeptidase
LLGIGIDEGTAIVVRRDVARVIGASAVLFHDKSREHWQELRAGQSFDLQRRTILNSP